MNIEEAREFALTLPGATEDMPYGPDWLVFRIGGKIFMHIWLEAPQPAVAIKLDPNMAAELRDRYDAVRPAYHLNKVHWSDVLIEDTFEEAQIKEWIRLSYELVRSKLPKRVEEELNLNE